MRQSVGVSLFEVQLGGHPHNAKPLKGFAGVLEIRDSYEGDAFRAVYTIRLEGFVYLLHAFQKKSTSGVATPKRHIELIRQHLRDAEIVHQQLKARE